MSLVNVRGHIVILALSSTAQVQRTRVSYCQMQMGPFIMKIMVHSLSRSPHSTEGPYSIISNPLAYLSGGVRGHQHQHCTSPRDKTRASTSRCILPLYTAYRSNRANKTNTSTSILRSITPEELWVMVKRAQTSVVFDAHFCGISVVALLLESGLVQVPSVYVQCFPNLYQMGFLSEKHYKLTSPEFNTTFYLPLNRASKLSFSSSFQPWSIKITVTKLETTPSK